MKFDNFGNYPVTARITINTIDIVAHDCIKFPANERKSRVKKSGDRINSINRNRVSRRARCNSRNPMGAI